MRNILVTYAVRRKAQRRGGDLQKVPLDDVMAMTEQQAEDILALNETLERLEPCMSGNIAWSNAGSSEA